MHVAYQTVSSNGTVERADLQLADRKIGVELFKWSLDYRNSYEKYVEQWTCRKTVDA